MYQDLNDYLYYQGQTYHKPERAGQLADQMKIFKDKGQAARQAFKTISEGLETALPPFGMDRVSNWASQAQIGRPHFWCYFYAPQDQTDDVALALRLYGQPEQFGISCEVSFVERKKSSQTLARQNRVLDLPIEPPLYYWAQIDGVSQALEGTEKNRQLLQQMVQEGKVRKVLVKKDIALSSSMTLSQLTQQLEAGMQDLLPYYQITKQ